MEKASNHINSRKSSRSRKTPAHLNIYEYKLPPSIETENAAGQARVQDQQVSDTQLLTSGLPSGVPSSPLRPMWQSWTINNSSSPAKVFSPRTSSSASEAWPGKMKSSDAKFPDYDSSLHIPVLKKFRAQDPVSESNSSPSISMHHLARKKEASDHTDLKDMIQHIPSPSNHDMFKKSVEDFFCEICQASCSSNLTFNQHLKGRRHVANLKWNRERRLYSEGLFTGNLRCDICQICCPDKVALEMHLKGKKHTNKLREVELREENAKKTIQCQFCLVNCMNENAFQQHLMGKQHSAKVELARKGLK